MTQQSTPPPLELAHKLASEGEDFYEESNLEAAAQRFEVAAEQYVRATLCTSDTESLQSLRLLAISHTQRAHEIVCRMRLHDAHVVRAALPCGIRTCTATKIRQTVENTSKIRQTVKTPLRTI